MYDMSELELIECEIVIQKLIKHYRGLQEFGKDETYSRFQKTLETIRCDIKGEILDKVGAYNV